VKLSRSASRFRGWPIRRFLLRLTKLRHYTAFPRLHKWLYPLDCVTRVDPSDPKANPAW
jgi:hypothetical protein